MTMGPQMVLPRGEVHFSKHTYVLVTVIFFADTQTQAVDVEAQHQFQCVMPDMDISEVSHSLVCFLRWHGLCFFYIYFMLLSNSAIFYGYNTII